MRNQFKSIIILLFGLMAIQQTHAQHPVVWKDVVGCLAYGNTVYNYGTTDTWGNSGAASFNQLPAATSGWVEMVAFETTTWRMLGLSATNQNANYTTIDFALYAGANGQLYVYESGVSMFNGTVFYKTDDVLRVERTGTTITYKKNGVTFYTSAKTSSSALIVDVAMKTNGAHLTNVLTSFPAVAGSGGGSGQWANASATRINYNNQVAIGGSKFFNDADYKLSVNGRMAAEELLVLLQADWPDYVFSPAYKLMNLSDLEAYIEKNKHLPGIPSATELKAKGGVETGEMSRKLMEKVEELTLYIIQQQKQIAQQQKQIEALQKNR